MRAYGTLGLLLQKNVAELCNGSTYDSDSYCLGSNPSSAANRKAPNFGAFCYIMSFIRQLSRSILATFWQPLRKKLPYLIIILSLMHF